MPRRGGRRRIARAPIRLAVVQKQNNDDKSSNTGSCRSLLQLAPVLQLHIWSLLPPNERALSCRLVCRDAHDALRDPHHSTALLSQPLPPHALPWAKRAGQQHMRRLPYRHRPQLLCTAAASGSSMNLEVAWAWLQPSIDLMMFKVCEPGDLPDPGEAAVRAGHPQLLGWLVRRCPGLLHPDRILQVAAELYDLAGLKRVWQVLDGRLNKRRHGKHLTEVGQGVLDAAAASHTADAVAKMEWLLSLFSVSCRLQTSSTAAAAACSGDLRRLPWLRDHGCPVYCWCALRAALQHAHLAVMEWLVAEAECELQEVVHMAAGARPADGPSVCEQAWAQLMQAAASGSDGVATLLWLREQGAPALRDMHVSVQQEVALAAMRAGRAEAVRQLLSYGAPGAVLPVSPEEAAHAAAASGSTAMAEFVRGAGAVFGLAAYRGAAEAGSVDMVRWLVREAGAPVERVWLREVIGAWPDRTLADARRLLEAVQLLVGAGHVSWVPQLDVAVAAQRGDLALLQYLTQKQEQQQQQEQQRTCVSDWLPTDRDTIAAVAAGGCVALLEWLAEQAPGFREALRAAGTGWYRERVCTFDKAMLAALDELLVQ